MLNSVSKCVFNCLGKITVPCSYKRFYAVIKLQNGEGLLNDKGMPKREFPNHWKGERGLYCVGLGMKGLAGICHDAKCVAADIKSIADSMGPF